MMLECGALQEGTFADGDGHDLRYRVEIASPAGDVASAEAFKRQVPVYDLSYLMNLY